MPYTTNLMNCPFCGGDAAGGWFAASYHIDCPACEFGMEACRADCDIERNKPFTDAVEASIKAHAIAKWNTRTTPSPA